MASPCGARRAQWASPRWRAATVGHGRIKGAATVGPSVGEAAGVSMPSRAQARRGGLFWTGALESPPISAQDVADCVAPQTALRTERKGISASVLSVFFTPIEVFVCQSSDLLVGLSSLRSIRRPICLPIFPPSRSGSRRVVKVVIGSWCSSSSARSRGPVGPSRSPLASDV